MNAGRGAGVLLLGLCALGAGAAAASGVPVEIRLSSPVISITPRYHGELVQVRGSAPARCDVVVELTSAPETVYCSRKGKVGPFWLAVGRVRFDGVPPMYKIRSTAPVDDIVCAADQLAYGLGERGLAAAIQVRSEGDRALFTEELILLRERDRLFSFREGSVERQGDAFRTTLYWPPDGPPGPYTVTAYAARDGRVVGWATAPVEVRVTGVEAWVRDLARAHGVEYGVFAVALAVAAGLGASFAFARRGRRRPAAGPAA